VRWPRATRPDATRPDQPKISRLHYTGIGFHSFRPTFAKRNALISANSTSTNQPKTLLLPCSPNATDRDISVTSSCFWATSGFQQLLGIYQDLLTNLPPTTDFGASNATKSCSTLNIASSVMGSVSRHFLVDIAAYHHDLLPPGASSLALEFAAISSYVRFLFDVDP